MVASDEDSKAVVSLLAKLKVIGPAELEVNETDERAVILLGPAVEVSEKVRGVVHVLVLVLKTPTAVIISATGSAVIKLLLFNLPPE